MHIKSESKLPGWAIAGKVKRSKFMSKGFVPSERSEKHTDCRDKGAKPAPRPYQHPTFSTWQNRLAVLLHEGKNDLILDIATSCGKTWATNLCIAHEIFSGDGTAIIVTPNIEVIREGMRDIMTNHVKKYRFPQNRMTDSITRKYSTYEENHMPSCQIMMISAESFVEFVTCSLNQDFIRRLRYIVFDEVHLKSVSHDLWWSTHIPHTAQLVLLSATIGNIEVFKQFARRPVEILTYRVRPIPLQYVLYRPPVITTGPSAHDGFASQSLIRAGHLSLEINTADPTARDIKSLDRTRDVPTDRDVQYVYGQTILTREMREKIERDLTRSLETACCKTDPATVYNLLSYLFANNMQPAMVFCRTAEAIKQLVEGVTAHIGELESADPEWKANQKNIDYYERKQHSGRDATRSRREEGFDEWDERCEEQEVQNHMTQLYEYSRKWRLPQTLYDMPSNVPQWIKTALDYGIGVYITTMPMYLKHYVFDQFKSGNISTIFADSSISVGINLPIRTAILCGDDISESLFRQASGRAGRRGLDTQGYIIPLMSKERVHALFSSREKMETVEIQSRFTFADLCRLNIPNNLDIYYAGESFSDKPETVPRFKQQILQSYMRECKSGPEGRQLELISAEQWHYHRLTNLLKNMPEQETIVFLKVLTTGALARMEPMELIALVQLLICRLPGSVYPTSLIPEPMYKAVSLYFKHYGLEEPTGPLDDYLLRYCRGEKLPAMYSEHLERIGDWLYTLRLEIERIAPKEDPVRKLVEKADTIFINNSRF